MPLARGNASPMRCAAKRNATICHKRQQVRSMLAARQHQQLSVIERLQHEQQQMMCQTVDHKRRRCAHDDVEAQDKKRQTTTSSTLSNELGQLTDSVHHVQHQVATAARHVQELRALLHGYVAQQRQAQAATCSQAISCV